MNKCSLLSKGDLDGKCWGIVQVVDSIDGTGVFRCKGHAEMFLWQPEAPDGGKYISELLQSEQKP